MSSGKQPKSRYFTRILPNVTHSATDKPPNVTLNPRGRVAMSHLIPCEICTQPFTPKRKDAVCCSARCRKQKSRYRVIAVERLTTLADEFNCTSDELVDWYQNDMTDVARLPIADIRIIVGDYLENHKAQRYFWWQERQKRQQERCDQTNRHDPMNMTRTSTRQKGP